MKKHKFGFTVVEMITAMTIVGVTSAFVIPLSVKSFNKHQYGAVLGKAVQQIMVGNQNIIQIANMNNDAGSFTTKLTNIDINEIIPNQNIEGTVTDDIATIAPAFWNVTDDDASVNIKNFDNTIAINPPLNLNDNNTTVLKFKNLNASVAINSDGNNANNRTGLRIFIDTTGFSNAPNTFGKDIFGFYLLDNGSLEPFGNEFNNGLQFTQIVVRNGFRITHY